MRHHPSETLRDAADSLRDRIAPAVTEGRASADLQRVITNLRLLEQVWHTVPDYLFTQNHELRQVLLRLDPTALTDVGEVPRSAGFFAGYDEHRALNECVNDLIERWNDELANGDDSHREPLAELIQFVAASIRAESQASHTDLGGWHPA